ncbi:MAG: biosynthetic-type acetolactate synthase large subunit [Bacillota bacterium]
MRMTGSDIVMECLLKEGVDTIFGFPGGAVIPLYDSLKRYGKHFRHILTSHEQGASHGADGYARSSGKTGVCFATSGPGATNTVTGIATAYSDSVPMVVITGQVASSLLGRDSFQEVDITSITMTITKHNYLVTSVEEIEETVREAFRIAGSGRKGPVLVDIPKDIMMTQMDFEHLYQPEEDHFEGNDEFQDMDRIVEMTNLAEKPIIYAGGGVISSGTSRELVNFAEKGDIPVVSSLMGLGGFPRDHRLSLGMVGMHGFKENNLAVCHSDLIIAVGARFSDRVIGKAEEFGPKAKVIQIDIDAAEIGKNKAVDGHLRGSMDRILKELASRIDRLERRYWLDEIHTMREEDPIGSEWSGISALKVANRMMPDAIVATDVGQHQMWTGQHWIFKKPRTFLSSGGLGTMGYGLGAAIGAQLANPKERVVLVTGDGSFRMNFNELGTVAKYDLPIVILLFNNNSLGMVRQWQGMFCDKRYSETDLGNEVDFIKLAGAFGIDGARVNSENELEEALGRVNEKNKAFVIECTFSNNQWVYPIVPAGKAINEMVYEGGDA